MTFGYPIWLWGLFLLPLLAFFFARAEQRGAEKLQLFVAARLLPDLAGTVNRARRIFRFVLLLLVLALILVSLARPRWGYAYDEVKRKGLDLLLAVDVSRSMLSNDVQPNRLERVKLATQDLINELQGDRVGLIAFAGRAFLQAPLTIDYSAAVDSINELDTKIIPEGGTNISEAIALATRTFGKAATGNRALIIFTDGEELSGDAVKTAKAAADAGVRLFTVGVGTPGGSLIPIQSENGGTAFVKDAKGEVVKSKLDEARLREVAQAAEGFYLHLENGPRTMQQLVTDGLGKMKVADINARLSRKPIERYEWPLAAAIFLFALALLINDRQRKSGGTGAVPSLNQKQGRHSPRRAGSGRPSQAIAVAIFLLVVRQGFAASAGLELYEQKKFSEAYEHFQQTLQENPGARQSDRIQFDAGAAAYKMKDYNKALQSFSQALLSKNSHLQSESHYNLGNTLYQRGEAEKSDDKKLTNWEEALKHYEETLKAEPQNKKARDNYDYVKKKIEELKKKQEEKPSPTPTPSPSPSPQKDQKDDQKKDDKDQQKQDKNDQQKKDGQQQSEKSDGSGEGEKSEDGQQSPSPTPSPSPSPSPSESPSPSPGEDGAGQSPTPTPAPSPSEGDQSGASPTPSPSEEATPSPTPGPGEQEGGENGEQPTPTPAGTPDKPLTGEVKGAGEEKPNTSPPPEVAAAEPDKEGEMSPKQAALLLQAMKDEEQKVQLDEHKPVRPVYNDW